MKIKFAAICLVLAAVSSTASAVERFEIQVSYGRWSMSPFVTLVERESEKLVRRGFQRLVEPTLPAGAFSSVVSNIDFSSSGQYLSLSLWYNFGGSRFSLGLRGNYTDFSLPYIISSQQSISFLNFNLVRLDAYGEGEVNLNSFTGSLLGRWKAFSSERFSFHLYAGMFLFPYEGDIYLQEQILLETPVGDISADGTLDHTIKQIREIDEDIPSFLISPELGAQLQYEIARNLGLYLDVSFSQGSFIGFGLFLTL